MADAWNTPRSTRTCAARNVEIPPETPYYSALQDTDEGMVRRDYSAEAWPEVERDGLYSYWKNKGYSLTQSKRPPVDWERLLSFFDTLDNADSREKRVLRYVLALILVRRRRLRLDDMAKTPDGGDRLVLFDRRDGGKTVEVTAPEVARDELLATQVRLAELFDGEITDNL